ncbi:ribonuclease P protein component [Spirulina sp. CS-785/01]|uniref:ribonuclease P protein component n=1 Tax=Spirulina sp. CS-785/01 TaxID=3021716 RepID=UPI00232B9B62|nr:ribonuclease P protein component [Spirulina sp. CS-785/01]MDB9313454.1 ribonuclease P protein component [Spirulina sp. CS-785/01]
MGLPKLNRLKHWRDFQRVYKQGTCHHGRYLVLRKWSTDQDSFGLTPPQIGIVVGKKVSKKATLRNRIKRQIRAILQDFLPSLKPGQKLIIGVKPKARECEYEHFLRELEQLLRKAEVLNGH